GARALGRDPGGAGRRRHGARGLVPAGGRVAGALPRGRCRPRDRVRLPTPRGGGPGGAAPLAAPEGAGGPVSSGNGLRPELITLAPRPPAGAADLAARFGTPLYVMGGAR